MVAGAWRQQILLWGASSHNLPSAPSNNRNILLIYDSCKMLVWNIKYTICCKAKFDQVILLKTLELNARLL